MVILSMQYRIDASIFFLMFRSIFGGLFSRVCEIHLSLAGHFVRRIDNPSPDIWNSRQTFHSEISGECEIFRWTFCPARSHSFAGHFQNSPEISLTLLFRLQNSLRRKNIDDIPNHVYSVLHRQEYHCYVREICAVHKIKNSPVGNWRFLLCKSRKWLLLMAGPWKREIVWLGKMNINMHRIYIR